jgi:hypothetical protein
MPGSQRRADIGGHAAQDTDRLQVRHGLLPSVHRSRERGVT